MNNYFHVILLVFRSLPKFKANFLFHFEGVSSSETAKPTPQPPTRPTLCSTSLSQQCTPSGRLSKLPTCRLNTEPAYKIQFGIPGRIVAETKHRSEAAALHLLSSNNDLLFSSASLEPEYSSGASSAHDGSIERRDG